MTILNRKIQTCPATVLENVVLCIKSCHFINWTDYCEENSECHEPLVSIVTLEVLLFVFMFQIRLRLTQPFPSLMDRSQKKNWNHGKGQVAMVMMAMNLNQPML
jgi:hypothetical protein